ncbi:MAG: GNAT family N-acetyltransferase [Rhodoglobus sp.]
MLVLPDFPVRHGRFSLRPVQTSDIDAIYSYRSLADVAAYLPHPPHTREQSAATVATMIEQSSLRVPGQWLDLAVEFGDSSEVVGEVLLKWDAQDPTMGEVGFVFHPSVHGTGLATETVTAALEIAFDQFQWERVIGVCDKRNLRSEALMRRVGMRREAEFKDAVVSKGERATQLQYAMTRNEWNGTKVTDWGGRSGREGDESEINSTMSAFFSAFASPNQRAVDLRGLRSLFLPDAIIVAMADGVTKQYDLESFIEPRQALLNSGRLLDFSEQELAADMSIFGDIAQRWSLYSKSGALDGRSSADWGRKGFQFVRTPAGWRISAIVWQDGAVDEQIPTA